VALEKSRLLDSGFIAIADDNSIRYLPSWVGKEDAQRAIADTHGDWVIKRLPLPKWGLTVVSAYPSAELQSRGSKIGYGVAIGGVVLCVAILLMLFVLLDMLLDRTVVQLLGGEPRAAVNYMASIATGDLAINIETSASRADSLMATLKIMQLKLKNMIVAVQGAAGEVTAQKADFEVAAAVYQHRRDESSAQELLRRIQAVSKTLALLEKAIGRFKL